MASQFNTSGVKTFSAGEDLAIYRRVKITSTGTAIYADADDLEDGITELAASSGDPVPVRLRTMDGTRKVTCSGAVSLGANLRGSDDGKVDDATSGGPSRFKALEAASGSGSIIEAAILENPFGGLLFSEIADSTAITATTVATAFDQAKTIDGGELQTGDVLEIIAQGFCTSTNSTDTLALDLIVGTETIASIAATDVANSDAFTIHAFVTVETAGLSGKLRGAGYTAIGASGTGACKHFRKASASEDLSVDLPIKVQATWSTNNSGNSCKLEVLDVIKHRQ